jgi:hypothetical protein
MIHELHNPCDPLDDMDDGYGGNDAEISEITIDKSALCALIIASFNETKGSQSSGLPIFLTLVTGDDDNGDNADEYYRSYDDDASDDGSDDGSADDGDDEDAQPV